MHVARKAESSRGTHIDASVQAFSEDTSGFEYLYSERHHCHLAATIVGHLANRGSVILVIGVGSADGSLIARFLDGEPVHRACLVSARPGMGLDELLAACGRSLVLPAQEPGSRRRTLLRRLSPQGRRGVTPVLIVERAEALDPSCFDALLRFAQHEAPRLVPIVLLASQIFAARLATPALGAISALVAFERLAQEEVSDFLQHQLHDYADDIRAMFTSEAIATIASAAQGDPIMVNRLARQILASADGPDGATNTRAAPASGAAQAPPPIATPLIEVVSDGRGDAEISEEEEISDEDESLQNGAVSAEGSAEQVSPEAPSVGARERSRAAALVGALALAGAALVGAVLYPSSPPFARRESTVATISLPPEAAPDARVTEAATAWLPADEAAQGPPPVPPLAQTAENASNPVTALTQDDATNSTPPVEPPPSQGVSLSPTITNSAATSTGRAASKQKTAARMPKAAANDGASSIASRAVTRQARSVIAAIEEPPREGEPPLGVEMTLAAEKPPAPPIAVATPQSAPPTVPPATTALAAVEPAAAPLPLATRPAPAVAPFLPRRELAETAPSTAEAASETAMPPSSTPKAASPELAPSPSDPPHAETPTKAISAPAPEVPPPAAVARPAAPAAALAALEPKAAAPPRAALAPAAPSDAAPPSAPKINPELALMLKRGDQLLAARDIVSARLFFTRAAGGGSSEAMCGVGKTFDPLYLRRLGVLGVSGNPKIAIDWYRKAKDAGSIEGEVRLNELIATYPR